MNIKILTLAIPAALTLLSGRAAETLPYYNPCSDLSTVTAIGDNGYVSAWKVEAYGSGNYANPAFTCKPASSSNTFKADATIFTPELTLEDGKAYKLTFVAGAWYTATAAVAPYTAQGAYLYASPDRNAAKTEIYYQTSPDGWNSSNATNGPKITVYFKGDSSKRYIGIGNRGGGSITRFGIDDIRVEEVDINTPDIISNLKGVINGKDVTISFTLPTKTVVGDPLQTIQSVRVMRDDKIIKEFSDQTAGAQISFTDNVSSAGEYLYTIVCGNNGVYGEADMISAKITGGILAPNQNGMSSPDTTRHKGTFGKNYQGYARFVPGEGVKIKWSYPLSEYFMSQIPEGQDKTTATVTRLKDGKVLVKDSELGEYLDSEIDLDSREAYQYKVDITRYTNKLSANSSVVSINNPLPFMPAVSPDALNEFTVVDADGDTRTWSVMTNGDANYHKIKKWFSGSYAFNADGDDWLITPGVLLEEGKSYRVDIDLLCASLIETPTQFMMTAGNSNAVEAMTDTVFAPFKFKHLTPRTYSTYYNSTSTGNAFFGMRTFDCSGDLGVAALAIYEVSNSLPEAVEMINVNYKETAGNATISFNAPLKTIGGVALTSLDKIELYCNDMLVETFSNPAPGELLSKDITFTVGTQDTYKTVPYTAAGPGLPTTVDVMVVEPPYENNFSNAASLTGFTVIDIQESGYTWGIQNGSARSYPDREYGHDDWLITPPMHFEKDFFYKIDFKTWLGISGGDDGEYYNNQLEVLLGTAPTIEAMTDTIISPIYVRAGFNSAEKDSAKEWFTVPETGEYYLGWHSMSQPYLGQELYLDDVRISAKIPGTYPGPVTDCEVIPDQNGGLSTDISFRIPENDLLGNPLADKVYYTALTRDGKELKNWGNQEPGTALTFTDSDVTEGVHLYTLTCYGYDTDAATAVPTRDVDSKLFVGLNKPAWVSFINAEENPEKYGEVTISWGAPEHDVDGYPLNTDKITYNVGYVNYNPATGSTTYNDYVSGGLFADGLSLTVDTKVNGQQFMKFYADAATPTHADDVHPGTDCAGGLQEFYENITPFMAVGKPYELPFAESFPNSNSSHGMMGKELDGIAMWGFNRFNPQTNVYPYDNDNGLAIMEAAVAYGSAARLHTGKILLNAEHPLLSMYVYNMSDGQHRDTNDLTISIGENMQEFTPVATKSIDEWTDGKPGWGKITVDLTEYAGQVVYIGFEGEAHRFYAYPGEEEIISFIHIDNVKIDESPAVDVSLINVSNTTAYVGTEHAVNVTIKNNAGKTLTGATVTLYLDNDEIATQDAPKVEPGEKAVVTFVNVIGRDNVGTHTYSAAVTASGDVDNSDNEGAGEAFTVIDNNYPRVENLKGAVADEGIAIEWDAPALTDTAEEKTDTFENYESWLDMYTGIGDYILVDADGLGVGGFQQGSIPVEMGSKQSFTLWDFSYEDADGYLFFGDDARYKAHSGQKCLVSMFGGLTSFTDDRLISPVLSGDAQTLSFYAKALAHAYPETFQVYYSTEGVSFDDFQNNYFPMETATGDWKEYRYQLPEGTKYFMIRHYSVGGYFFFLDDLTFTPAGNANLQLLGYNVYHEGEKVNETPTGARTWTDTKADTTKDNTYQVTAVYDRGESPEAEVTVSKSSGVDAIGAVGVYVRNGEIVISGAAGKPYTVASASAVTIATGTAEDVTRIAVEPGIYVVTLGSRSYKVVVK